MKKLLFLFIVGGCNYSAPTKNIDYNPYWKMSAEQTREIMKTRVNWRETTPDIIRESRAEYVNITNDTIMAYWFGEDKHTYLITFSYSKNRLVVLNYQ